MLHYIHHHHCHNSHYLAHCVFTFIFSHQHFQLQILWFVFATQEVLHEHSLCKSDIVIFYFDLINDTSTLRKRTTIYNVGISHDTRNVQRRFFSFLSRITNFTTINNIQGKSIIYNANSEAENSTIMHVHLLNFMVATHTIYSGVNYILSFH